MNALFNMAALEKRKTANQKQFEKENRELLGAFPRIVDAAFARLNGQILNAVELVSRNRNLKATAISGYLAGALKKDFKEYCAASTNGRFRLQTPSGDWVYVKKLYEGKNGLRPQNIPTRNTTKIYNQLSDEKEDLRSNIFIGYTATKDMTAAVNVFAICFDGEKTIWVSDLRTLAARGGAVVKQAKQQKAEPILKPGTVRIKKRSAG